jgi:hypothetical protein
MANDEIIEADVRRILQCGVVVWVEFKKEELLHVEGRDSDGRLVRLVVAVYTSEVAVKIVTAMVRWGK